MAGTALGQLLGKDFGIDLGIDLCGRLASSGLTPSTIVSTSQRRAWFKSDAGVTLNGSNVSGWANQWSNGDFAQATAAKQPPLTASVFGSLPALSNLDDARLMAGTLTSGVAVGSRMYVWCYCQFTTLPAAFRYFAGCNRGSQAARCMVCAYNSGNWRVFNDDNNGHAVSVDTGLACDLSPHLVEAGLTTGGSNQLVVSGAGFSNTTMSTVAASASTALTLFSSNGSLTTQGCIGHVGEFIVMQGEPSLQQKVAMRQYFAARYGAI